MGTVEPRRSIAVAHAKPRPAGAGRGKHGQSWPGDEEVPVAIDQRVNVSGFLNDAVAGGVLASEARPRRACQRTILVTRISDARDGMSLSCWWGAWLFYQQQV